MGTCVCACVCGAMGVVFGEVSLMGGGTGVHGPCGTTRVRASLRSCFGFQVLAGCGSSKFSEVRPLGWSSSETSKLGIVRENGWSEWNGSSELNALDFIVVDQIVSPAVGFLSHLAFDMVP